MDEIRRRFGDKVARIVEETSDTLEIPKPPWRDRKETYLAHLKTTSPSAVRVSLADKLHNARAIARDYEQIRDEVWTRFNAPPDDVLWYHRSLADIFRRRSTSPMALELDRVVTELERARREALVPKITDKIMMPVSDQADYLDGPEYGILDELPEEERQMLLDQFARREQEEENT